MNQTTTYCRWNRKKPTHMCFFFSEVHSVRDMFTQKSSEKASLAGGKKGQSIQNGIFIFLSYISSWIIMIFAGSFLKKMHIHICYIK